MKNKNPLLLEYQKPEPKEKIEPKSPLLDIVKLSIRNTFTFEAPINAFGVDKLELIKSNPAIFPKKNYLVRILQENSRSDLLNKFLFCGKTYRRSSGSGQEIRDYTEYECSDCGHKGTVKQRCGLPICPDCIADRSKRILGKFWPFVKDFKNPKLLTLTIPNIPYLTSLEIRKIIKAFGKLRRLVLWNRVIGGIYAIEITNIGNGFHIHIHAVLDSPYIPRNKIKTAWEKYTGGFMVDIRRVKSGTSGLCECVAYIGNAKNNKGELGLPKIYNPKDMILYADITPGIRMVGTFGKLYGIKFENKPSCSRCGSENLKYRIRREIIENKNQERFKMPPPWEFLVSGDIVEKRRQIEMAISGVCEIRVVSERGYETLNLKRILPSDCHSQFLISTGFLTPLEVYGLIKSGLVKTDDKGYIWFNRENDNNAKNSKEKGKTIQAWACSHQNETYPLDRKIPEID